MIEFLEIGEVVAVHGIKGEFKIYPWTDSPKALNGVKTLYFDASGSSSAEIFAHDHGRMILCKAKGTDTPEQARRLVGQVLYAARKDISLPKGAVFLADTVGLAVRHADTGELIGTVIRAERMLANDVYYIELPGGEVRMVPAVKEYVTGIDLERNELYLRPIKGMLSDED